jgi:hypothetical protein
MLDAGAKGLSANEEKRRDKAVELVSSVLVSSILLSLFCL